MFSDPVQNVAALGLTEGMRVADFGAGTGDHTLAVGKRVGAHGKVYAIDVNKNLLDRLQSEAKRQGVLNLEIIWGDLEKRGGSTLKEDAVDLVLLANVLFQSEARYSMLLEARRIVRPGGRVAVIEWSDSFAGLGPAPESVVQPTALNDIAIQAGLRPEREFAAGAHHYGRLFVK